jgi:predicted GH43/DUF377 family glycosyl hydrolase
MPVQSQQELPRWALGPFVRPEKGNPVIGPNPDSVFDCPIRMKPVYWEFHHTFNPAAVVKSDKVYLLYRAEDNFGEMKIGRHTSRLGLAESTDGIHFTRFPTPVVFPDNDDQRHHEWPGGCEDPRLVEADTGDFVLLYTQKDHYIPRLGVAISRDLVHWTKCEQAFYRKGRPWRTIDTKAASIVCKLIDGRLIATKFDGKYWMYWGVRDLHFATSDNLINWETQETVIHRRPGFFDVLISEAGPPAVLTDDGIVLIYNGKNDIERGDPTLSHHLYTGGQILFDKNYPTKCIGRLDHPFYRPELPFELTGQYVAGTTFLEGLVYFHEKWFLYYGCADSFVGVAIWDPQKKV